MEQKRSAVKISLSKGKMSRTQVLKTPSDISLTPSQMAEQETKNRARKNPLDSLSRMSVRPTGLERRSGLQDVNDEYFKKNVFSKSTIQRSSGLDDYYNSIQSQQTTMAAGQSKVPLMESYKMQTGGEGDAPQMSPSQAQMHQQAQMQQQQAPMSGNAAAAAVAAAAQKQQIQQQQMQMQQQQMQQQQKQQKMQQQQPQVPFSGNPEPDICTTCPHCQTTIFLVRNNESAMVQDPQAGIPAAGQMHYDQPSPPN